MSTDIDQSFVKQYEAEVKAAYQRRGSRLRGTARTVNDVMGESTTFQKVGKGSASTKTRHGEIPPMNIDHTPVECTLKDFYAGDWVDKLDTLKIKHDERRVQVDAGAWGLGRKTDELLVTAVESATNDTAVNLSAVAIGTLTGWVTRLADRDVPLGDGNVYGVVSWKLWSKMLQITEFASADFVGPDRLPFPAPASPKVWMDVIWFPFTGLNLNANVRENMLYHRDAIGHAIGAEVQTDITWHGDRASWFVNNMMSQGACRIDDDGVEKLSVNESA